MQRYGAFAGQNDEGPFVLWEDAKELLEKRNAVLKKLREITGKCCVYDALNVVQFGQTQRLNQIGEIIKLREDLRIANLDKDVQKLLRVRDVAVKRLFEVTGKNSVVDVIQLIKSGKTQQDNQAKEIIRLRKELRVANADKKELRVIDADRKNAKISSLREELRVMDWTFNIKIHQLEKENKELRKELRKKLNAADNEINRLIEKIVELKEKLRVVDANRGKLVEVIVKLEEKLRVVSINKDRIKSVIEINRLREEWINSGYIIKEEKEELKDLGAEYSGY